MSFLTRYSSIHRFTRIRSCQSHMVIRGSSPKKSDVAVRPFTTHIGRQELKEISRYLLYTAVVIPTSYTVCLIWNYENQIKRAFEKRYPKPQKVIRQMSVGDRLKYIWNKTTPGKKVAITIITANAIVFGLWRIPRFNSVLMRYFATSPTKAHSVVSSTLYGFSHMKGWHFLLNMYILYSFSDVITIMMKHELYVATYIAGATFAGMISAVAKIVQKRTSPTVGASGALMSLFAIYAIFNPDSRINFIFVSIVIPHSIKGSIALCATISIDILGLLFRWRFFDHAAHLGGVLFGVAIVPLLNSQFAKRCRQKLLDKWVLIRK